MPKMMATKGKIEERQLFFKPTPRRAAMEISMQGM